MDPWAANRLEQRLLIARILWLMLSASLAVYGVVLFVKTKDGSVPLGLDVLRDPMALVMYPMADVAFALAFLVPRFFLSPSKLRETLARPWNEESLRSERDGDGRRVWADADIPRLPTLRGRDAIAMRLTGPYLIAKLLSWALLEASALFGFMVGLMKNSLEAFFPAASLAVVGFFLARPSRENFQELVSEAERSGHSPRIG